MQFKALKKYGWELGRPPRFSMMDFIWLFVVPMPMEPNAYARVLHPFSTSALSPFKCPLPLALALMMEATSTADQKIHSFSIGIIKVIEDQGIFLSVYFSPKKFSSTLAL
jgi:hypothetical protein